MNERKLYLVSPVMQKEEVDEYCFKRCQKIKMGVVDLGILYGPFFPCTETTCEFVKKTMNLKQQFKGQELIIRKLKTKKQ